MYTFRKPTHSKEKEGDKGLYKLRTCQTGQIQGTTPIIYDENKTRYTPAKGPKGNTSANSGGAAWPYSKKQQTAFKKYSKKSCGGK